MSVSEHEAEALIAAVRRVSAEEITPRFRALDGAEIGTKSSADDLVTVADRASEAALSEAVAPIMPDARVIGEEAVSEDRDLLSGVTAPGRTVIIDPIDGTWNYANGISTYGVILAVIEDGETQFGLLYDPTCDDWISAHAGAGAWFSRPGAAPVRMRTSDTARQLDERFGYVGLYLFGKPGQALIAETLPRFRRTMSLRCSCHEYRMITQGRADFVLNGMLNVWDHAAGVLALREAGGVARLLDGRDYAPGLGEGYLLTAANEALWEELAGLWRPLNGA